MMSSVARKNVMAVTGLLSCAFLVVHVLGNLPLLVAPGRGQLAFNRYAALLSGLVPIKLVELTLLAGIALHTVMAGLLTLRARGAAGERSVRSPAPATAPWSSRFMGVSGVVLLVFLAVHLCDFWYPYKFAGVGVGEDAAGQRDLYGLVVSVLGRGAHAVFYVVAMLALGVHVRHGVYSGFRSLGLYPPGLARVARAAGSAFAALVTACFVAMTVSVFLRQGSL